MGSPKGWIPFQGEPLIERIGSRLRGNFAEVIVAANDETYDRCGLRRVPDILPSGSPLAGIHAVLSGSRTEWCFVCGCDMPFVSVALASRLWESRGDADLVIPRSARGLEPLHALYSRNCLPALEGAAAEGAWKLQAFPARVRARVIEVREGGGVGEGGSPFANVNTPGEAGELSRMDRSPE